jgi:hypothetical protein
VQPAQDWHVVAKGVPVQLGTWNSVGADGRRPIVPQQMRALPTVQSLSEEQDFGQVAEQMPSQQSGERVLPLQSESDAHDLGHAVACKQRDFAARLCSRLLTVEQQISPAAVLHCAFIVQVVGQSFSGVQNGVE